MESLNEHIFKKVLRSPQTVAKVTKAVADNPAFIAPTAVVNKPRRRRWTDGRAKIEERWRQYNAAGMKLNLFIASN